MSSFWAAAHQGDIDRLREMIDQGQDLDAYPPAGDSAYRPTALAYAVWGNQPDAASLLLECGANPNQPDGDENYYPLHWASYHRDHADCAQILVGAGADLDVRSHKGYTPLQLAKGENGLVSRKPGVTAVLEEAACSPYPPWVPPQRPQRPAAVAARADGAAAAAAGAAGAASASAAAVASAAAAAPTPGATAALGADRVGAPPGGLDAAAGVDARLDAAAGVDARLDAAAGAVAATQRTPSVASCPKHSAPLPLTPPTLASCCWWLLAGLLAPVPPRWREAAAAAPQHLRAELDRCARRSLLHALMRRLRGSTGGEAAPLRTQLSSRRAALSAVLLGLAAWGAGILVRWAQSGGAAAEGAEAAAERDEPFGFVRPTPPDAPRPTALSPTVPGPLDLSFVIHLDDHAIVIYLLPPVFWLALATAATTAAWTASPLWRALPGRASLPAVLIELLCPAAAWGALILVAVCISLITRDGAVRLDRVALALVIERTPTGLLALATAAWAAAWAGGLLALCTAAWAAAWAAAAPWHRQLRRQLRLLRGALVSQRRKVRHHPG